MTDPSWRTYYLSVTREHIDRQIAELRDKRADIEREFERIRALPAIPSPEVVVRRCVEVRDDRR